MRTVKSSDLDETEIAIRQAVDAVASEPGHGEWKDAVWTKHIKNAIVTLGHKRGWHAYASSAECATRGEWLFDVAWTDEPSGFLRSVPLVLEMEWHFGEVDDDFHKLVAARAEHRVMLFNYPTGHSREIFLERLLTNVTTFVGTMPGDRYLFGGWVEEADCFEWKLAVAIARDGTFGPSDADS